MTDKNLDVAGAGDLRRRPQGRGRHSRGQGAEDRGGGGRAAPDAGTAGAVRPAAAQEHAAVAPGARDRRGLRRNAGPPRGPSVHARPAGRPADARRGGAGTRADSRLLSDAAAAEGFVEYPVYKDGHVRSVPLLMLLDGRAAAPDRSEPRDAHAGRVGRGPPHHRRRGDDRTQGARAAADVVIPVRALRPEGGGSTIPYTFDIPWVGTSDWQRMFRNPHLSVDKVYEVIHLREKLAENNARSRYARLDFLLERWDETFGTTVTSWPEFRARHLRAGTTWIATARADRGVLEQYDDTIPEDTKEEDGPGVGERRRSDPVDACGGTDARADGHSRRQLDKQRSELRSIMNGKAVLIGWAATAAIADRKPTSIHPDGTRRGRARDDLQRDHDRRAVADAPDVGHRPHHARAGPDAHRRSSRCCRPGRAWPPRSRWPPCSSSSTASSCSTATT